MRKIAIFFIAVSLFYMTTAGLGILFWDYNGAQLLFMNMMWSLSLSSFGGYAQYLGWIKPKWGTLIMLSGFFMFIMSIIYSFHNL